MVNKSVKEIEENMEERYNPLKEIEDKINEFANSSGDFSNGVPENVVKLIDISKKDKDALGSGRDDFDPIMKASIANDEKNFKESMSLSDQAQLHIQDLKDNFDASYEDIAKVLKDEFGYDNSVTSEELEDYEKRQDPKSKEATSGEIETAAENMKDEGFSDEHVLKQLQAIYDYSYSELRKILKGYLDEDF